MTTRPYKCSTCGTLDPKNTCSKCKDVRYCNTDCQRQDWPKHKRTCQYNIEGVYLTDEEFRYYKKCVNAIEDGLYDESDTAIFPMEWLPDDKLKLISDGISEADAEMAESDPRLAALLQFRRALIISPGFPTGNVIQEFVGKIVRVLEMKYFNAHRYQIYVHGITEGALCRIERSSPQINDSLKIVADRIINVYKGQIDNDQVGHVIYRSNDIIPPMTDVDWFVTILYVSRQMDILGYRLILVPHYGLKIKKENNIHTYFKYL